MLFGETVAVYCENRMEYTNTLCEQNSETLLSKELVNIVTAAFYRVNASEVNKFTIFDLFAVFMRQLLRHAAAAGRPASKALQYPLGEQ
jgi:hypothetical protein